jgi:hypothetical protein
MQRIVDPRQTHLFDPYGPAVTARNRQWLQENWPGVFRHVILELMPVGHDLSVRTLERYQTYFEQDGLAQRVMHEVTTRLVGVLELKIDQQRLDSTHVFSDMAQLGRTRLMGVALKRFLTQVKRHDPPAYESLPQALRQRYVPSEHQLFGDVARDKESRRLLRQQVAQDMHQLLQQFAEQPAHAKRGSYQAMERIFYEQCEVQQEKVTVKDKTGNTVMQNPSDPDAGYDGHKGPGYQARIAETCHPDPHDDARHGLSAVCLSVAVPGPREARRLSSGAHGRFAGRCRGTDGLGRLPRSVPGPASCHSGILRSGSSCSGPQACRMNPDFWRRRLAWRNLPGQAWRLADQQAKGRPRSPGPRVPSG